MQTLGWQQHFLDLIQGRDTVVCYGNVKDRYAFRAAGRVVTCSFLETIARLLHPRFGACHAFDPLERLRRLTVQADTVLTHRADGDVPHLAPFDEFNTSPQLLQDVTALARAVTVPLPVPPDPAPLPRVLVIDHAAAIMCHRPMRCDDDEMRLLLMRKMIDDLAPGRKLVLIYLYEGQIPRELSASAPRVGLFEVPLPTREERALVPQNRRLPERLVPFYANLTEGLSLTETARILEESPFLGGTAPEAARAHDVERAINRFKFGQRPDYYQRLSVAKLERAREFFRDGVVVDDHGEAIDQIPGVRGQDEAIDAVLRSLWRAKANVGTLLRDPGSLPPRGVLFFCGPSGTGKTLLAKRIARFLFDSEEAFTRFDMSEYMQDFAVTRLIGAPPGYVGSDRGGQLTNAVREKPFSVLLFDEVEKAHPRVIDIFLQILSDGRLTDGRGQSVFFSESIVVFTSNLGTRSHRSAGTGSGVGGLTEPSPERGEYEALVRRHAAPGEVRRHFVDAVCTYYEREISRPELLNRIGSNIVPFLPIYEHEITRDLFRSYIDKLVHRFHEVYGERAFRLRVRDDVLPHLTERYAAAVARFGGRAVVNVLEDELLTVLARALLKRFEDRDTTFVCRVVADRLFVD